MSPQPIPGIRDLARSMAGKNQAKMDAGTAELRRGLIQAVNYVSAPWTVSVQIGTTTYTNVPFIGAPPPNGTAVMCLMQPPLLYVLGEPSNLQQGYVAPASFSNSWVGTGPGLLLQQLGWQVLIFGEITAGSVGVAFTVPADLIPTKTSYLIVTATTTGVVTCDIDTSGHLNIFVSGAAQNVIFNCTYPLN